RMLSLLLLSLLPLLVRSVDVSTSVYCRSECREYIATPDTLIPYCDDEFMRGSSSCGTVISCDLREANKERILRSLSNSTCCVHTVIKEHGDCDLRSVDTAPRIEPTLQVSSQLCSSSSWMLWTIASLLFVLLLQSLYIIFLLLKCRQSSVQKISQWSDRHSSDIATQPILLARPLIQP
ncbi:hypothetical protein PFISCL1PPCAC_5455, partial [Pristionchus fissidentatus]